MYLKDCPQEVKLKIEKQRRASGIEGSMMLFKKSQMDKSVEGDKRNEMYESHDRCKYGKNSKEKYLVTFEQ